MKHLPDPRLVYFRSMRALFLSCPEDHRVYVFSAARPRIVLFWLFPLFFVYDVLVVIDGTTVKVAESVEARAAEEIMNGIKGLLSEEGSEWND
jgi:hypothetical protein